MSNKNWTIHFEQHQLSIVHWIERHSLKSGLMWGIIIGFVANTLIAMTLANIYQELHSSTTVDRVVENRLSNMQTELEWFKEEFTPEPPTPKDFND